MFVLYSYSATKIKRPIWAFYFCAEIGVRTRQSHDSGVGSTMSRFCKHSTAKPSGMPHSPAIRGAREYFISARNKKCPVWGIFYFCWCCSVGEAFAICDCQVRGKRCENKPFCEVCFIWRIPASAQSYGTGLANIRVAVD